MQSIRGAMGALVLASLSTTAAATTVELEFQITVNWKENVTIIGGVNGGGDDLSFQPVTFQTTIRFELENPRLELDQRSNDTSRSWVHFATPADAFPATPFTEALQVPPERRSQSQTDLFAYYGQFQEGVFHAADEAMAVWKQAAFATQTYWSNWPTDDIGRWSSHFYIAGISLYGQGDPLSTTQFTFLSPEDALTYLQAKVGVLHRSAFQESSEITVPGSNFLHPLDHYQTRYIGDVVLRSVSVVPEPSTLLLMLFGGAMVAAARITRQRRAD